MIKNAQSLKDRCKNYSRENNVDFQEILQNFMFERFLDRLSHSEYKENFIIKGGALLSNIMGLNMRTTQDIDGDLINMIFNQPNVENMILKIIDIDLKDGITFDYLDVSPIKEDNKYGGYRFKLLARFENMRVPFIVDISYGDIIVPEAIKYEYKTTLENDSIELYSYNYESVIAEKLQIILSKKENNSRMKDFYDLYYFVIYKWNTVNQELLKSAIQIKFKHQEIEYLLNEFDDILNTIESNIKMSNKWLGFRKRKIYARDIEYTELIEAIRKMKELL